MSNACCRLSCSVYCSKSSSAAAIDARISPELGVKRATHIRFYLTASQIERNKMAATFLTSTVLGAGTNGRPVVFFDISIGDNPVGRIKMELFSDICPR